VSDGEGRTRRSRSGLVIARCQIYSADLIRCFGAGFNLPGNGWLTTCPMEIPSSLMKLTRRITLVLLLVGVFGVWVFSNILERSYQEQAKNYSQIEQGLYMGGDEKEPPPGTGAVLNLCSKRDPYQCGVHVWKPIRDTTPAPDIAWLRDMVQFVARQRQAGLTVYVHCRNGVSRSGLVVTAYLMDKHRWTRDQALAYLRSKRPMARPNLAFMELLKEWEDVPGKRGRDS
jgi:hypothetical protein